MTDPKRIAGDDCSIAAPPEVDQKGLQRERQTPEQWLRTNRQAMKRYNERVTAHDVFSAGVRCF
ncbi:type II toxin-antitoxin system CcdA family antitoxin [Pseudomonas asplenii]|uniref:type II toxin-antitoxin system CcdA family antitoxin n=1 Tax=Pseudomonas asplenii TaxID=53407 RepID=UPI0022B6D00F|nr:type II toxin-antitoxin system CcdA family antitoxin [Pseudomonas fuscovaginae]